jgi:hypothetical protein
MLALLGLVLVYYISQNVQIETVGSSQRRPWYFEEDNRDSIWNSIYFPRTFSFIEDIFSLFGVMIQTSISILKNLSVMFTIVQTCFTVFCVVALLGCVFVIVHYCYKLTTNKTQKSNYDINIFRNYWDQTQQEDADRALALRLQNDEHFARAENDRKNWNTDRTNRLQSSVANTYRAVYFPQQQRGFSQDNYASSLERRRNFENLAKRAQEHQNIHQMYKNVYDSAQKFSWVTRDNVRMRDHEYPQGLQSDSPLPSAGHTFSIGGRLSSTGGRPSSIGGRPFSIGLSEPNMRRMGEVQDAEDWYVGSDNHLYADV